MEVKRASTHQKQWISTACEHCRTKYSCLIDEYGFADTGFLGLAGIVPSDQTMREAAHADLRANTQRSLASIPCPECGCFGSFWVETVRARAGRLWFWLGFVGAVILFSVLAVVLAPKMPAWTLFIILAAGWVAARFVSQAMMVKTDPNRELRLNLMRVKRAMDKGILRIDQKGTL